LSVAHMVPKRGRTCVVARKKVTNATPYVGARGLAMNTPTVLGSMIVTGRGSGSPCI
jgi:hypothetical protein